MCPIKNICVSNLVFSFIVHSLRTLVYIFYTLLVGSSGYTVSTFSRLWIHCTHIQSEYCIQSVSTFSHPHKETIYSRHNVLRYC
jgi:hypothetical protein